MPGPRAGPLRGRDVGVLPRIATHFCPNYLFYSATSAFLAPSPQDTGQAVAHSSGPWPFTPLHEAVEMLCRKPEAWAVHHSQATVGPTRLPDVLSERKGFRTIPPVRDLGLGISPSFFSLLSSVSLSGFIFV